MKPRGSAASVLGNRLRQLREAWGLVLQDVANLFGTNRNVPSQWEGGLREPSYDHLLRLADFYGVTVDWLLGREGAEKDSPRVGLVKNQLHDYLRLREATLRGTTPGNRMKVAIDFLVLQDPELFTVERVARQLVISSESLALMLDDQVMATPLVVQRFAQYTNLPEIWFYQPVPQLEDPFVKYRTLVERFQAEGLSPDDVEQRLWGSRRTSRRTKRAEHE